MMSRTLILRSICALFRSSHSRAITEPKLWPIKINSEPGLHFSNAICLLTCAVSLEQ